MSFNHNRLVTHGIATTDESQGPVKAVLFDMKEFKAAGNETPVRGIPLFLLADIHPEALQLLMSSVHLYQMVIRNSIGLEYIRKEIIKARQHGAVGPIFAKEVQGWIDELQKLNAATRTLVIDGQEAADVQVAALVQPGNVGI